MAKTFAELFKQQQENKAALKTTYLKGGTFSDIIDVVQTPWYGMAGALSGEGVKAGIQQRMSMSEVTGVRGIPGFALDVLTDPTSYIGIGGLTKLGLKATTKGIAKKTLGAAAKTGERALLTLDIPFIKGGIPLLPQRVSKTVLGGATKAAQPLRRALGQGGTTALRMLSAAPTGSSIDAIEKLAKAESGALDFLKNVSASERAGFAKMFSEVRDINKQFIRLEKEGLLTPEDARKIADRLTVDESILLKDKYDIKLSSVEAENIFKQSEDINTRLQTVYEKYGGAKLEGKKAPLLLADETKEFFEPSMSVGAKTSRKYGKAGTKFAEHIRFESADDVLVGTSEKLGFEQYDKYIKKFTQEKGTLQGKLKGLLKKEKTLNAKIGKKAFMSGEQRRSLLKASGAKNVDEMSNNKVEELLQGGKVTKKSKKLRALFKEGGVREGIVKGQVRQLKSELKGVRETITKEKDRLRKLLERDTKLEKKAFELGASPDQIFVGEGPSGPRLYKRTAATGTSINKAAQRELIKTGKPLEQLGLKARQAYKQRAATKFVDEFTTNAEKFGGVKIVDGEIPEGMARSTLPELKGLAFPESVQKIMDSTYEKFSTMESVNEFLKKLDAVQNVWKKTATFWNPAFHFRNGVSNQWQLFLGDALNPVDALAAGKMMFKNRRTLEAEIKAGGKLSKDAKIWKMFTDDFGLGGTGWVGGDIEQQLTKLKINPIDKLGGKVGEAVEDSAKLTMFLNRLRKGYIPEEAALDVRKFLFDYGDLSDIERQYFKRALPFYTWTRNNIPLQVSMLIQKPGKFSMIDKIKRGVESSQEDKPMDAKYLPEWMKEAYPVYFGKDGKGLQRFFQAEGFIPAVDLNKIGRMHETVMDLLSPLIKTPLELAANYDFFYERQIKEFEGQKGEVFRQEVPKTVEKLAKSFRPLTEMERIFAPKREFGESPAVRSRIYTYLFGKMRAYDVEKSKDTYEYLNALEIRKITQAINSAKKRGNKNAEKRLKELLKETKSQKS